MFKCDLCQDLLMEGKTPACIEACPQKAMLIGPREDIMAEAERRAAAMGGHIYGKEENGGTSTLYVSRIPFEELNAAIEKGPGRPHLDRVKRKMARTDPVASAVITSPVVGLVAGVALAAGARLVSRREEGHE